MKIFIVLLCTFSMSILASVVCTPSQIYIWTPTEGYICANNPATLNTISGCFGPPQAQPQSVLMPWLQTFPQAMYQPQILPWWAYQGNMYFPNLNYPGPWNYPGIQGQYYPGHGQVFAAKPNVYVSSIHKKKKFAMQFTSPELNFLATTPVLDKTNSWKASIVDGDKFEVNGINYDYLFYDIRLPKEKMQFEHGVCATREHTIVWMLSELKTLNYPLTALQDFEEHWRVKIPDYNYYCIYPQYNSQLDEALPVNFNLEQSSFTRALFVLVPHKDEPDLDTTYSAPLPTKNPESLRPSVKITREIMFREWGVAFLEN